MTTSKNHLQNIWENTWYNAKMYFKSHDLSQIIQLTLLFVPVALSIISLSCSWMKLLDIISTILSVFALVYFIWFWKNQELFMECGEKYLELYHRIENYYKNNNTYDNWIIEDFNKELSDLNIQKRPEYHIFAKIWVEKTIDKEMTYSNENHPWYK